MTTVIVKTSAGEIIERIPLSETQFDDDECNGYIMTLINLAIRNALAIDAGTLVPIWTPVSSLDPNCTCTPLIEDPCPYCQTNEERRPK